MESEGADLAQATRLPDAIVERMVSEHGNEILRVARRYSSCPSDAEDAYQGALEALMTKAPPLDEGRLSAWLAVVVRNEALMIRRRGKHLDATSFEEIADEWPALSDAPDERAARSEALSRQRDALRRIKPDQMRCLLLKAGGMSYEQICETTGISYASVNRHLTDGRRAFRAMLGRIESGAECRRLEPALSRVADSAADENEQRDVIMHLEHCPACRVTLADFRAAPSRVSVLLPVGLATGPTTSGDWLQNATDQVQGFIANAHERLGGLAQQFQSGGEMAFAKKAAAATMAIAALAGGGLGAQQLVAETNLDIDGPEFAVQPLPSPTGAAGPTTGAGPDSRGVSSAVSAPVAPSQAELIGARDSAVAAEETTESDAAPTDDPFAEEPHFEQPEALVEDPQLTEEEPYGGLAP